MALGCSTVRPTCERESLSENRIQVADASYPRHHPFVVDRRIMSVPALRAEMVRIGARSSKRESLRMGITPLRHDGVVLADRRILPGDRRGAIVENG